MIMKGVSELHYKKYPQGGFSLVELMVSVSIFAIAMIISISTLLVIIDANAKAQATSAAMTNLSYAFDNITRNLRTGRLYYCTGSGADMTNQLLTSSPGFQDCNNEIGIVYTREIDGVRTGYRLSSQRIQEYHPARGSWVPITGSDVRIDRFSLFVIGSATDDPATPSIDDIEQPKVKILITGHINNGLDTDTDFKLQTHIVQRIIDL